ncbi:MarR family transcriptional regulator [Picosynechococcus sp. PCC 11901]|uniref:MarR family transcriptional regulator n=2 Tax=Picosynechococcus sp. PCC 11901 TaxID=2579791 RepID=UPI0030DD104C
MAIAPQLSPTDAMAPLFVDSLKQQFHTWFTQQQATTEEAADLVELPDTLSLQLARQLETLASPEGYCAPVKTSITEAIETWQTNLEAPNSFVLLGNPVEPLPKILSESIPRQTFPDLEILTPLACLQRPLHPRHISQQIQKALELYPQIDLSPGDRQDQPTVDQLEQRQTLVIIPCLEQCFLRCIGGWEGIETLRDITIQNRHCFWIMSCNHWAWDFLDFVGQISAYFSHVDTLPKLKGEMLQTWLEPIAQVVLPPPNVPEELPEDTAESDSPKGERLDDWQNLASQADGTGQIAANLWLQSLRIHQEQIEQHPNLQFDFDATDPHQQPLTLESVKPALPSLPSLASGDLYILHSVLIHGQISRAHLALSLGESRNRIQARIQWLLRQGVLRENQGALSIQAAHYIRLKSELANNNFFVGED